MSVSEHLLVMHTMLFRNTLRLIILFLYYCNTHVMLTALIMNSLPVSSSEANMFLGLG